MLQAFPLEELGHCKRVKKGRDDGALLAIMCPAAALPEADATNPAEFLKRNGIPVDECLGKLCVFFFKRNPFSSLLILPSIF